MPVQAIRRVLEKFSTLRVWVDKVFGLKSPDVRGSAQPGAGGVDSVGRGSDASGRPGPASALLLSFTCKAQFHCDN